MSGSYKFRVWGTCWAPLGNSAIKTYLGKTQLKPPTIKGFSFPFTCGLHFISVTILEPGCIFWVSVFQWGFFCLRLCESRRCTGQRMKFFYMKDFFSKCGRISSFLRIWSHILNKSLVENFILYAVVDYNADYILYMSLFKVEEFRLE